MSIRIWISFYVLFVLVITGFKGLYGDVWVVLAGIALAVSLLLTKHPLWVAAATALNALLHAEVGTHFWIAIYYWLMGENNFLRPSLLRSMPVWSSNLLLLILHRWFLQGNDLYLFATTAAGDLLIGCCVLAVTSNMRKAVIKTKEQYEERARLSSHDSLTGLYNYDIFHKRLEMHLCEYDRLTVLLLDCTDLKTMNDTQGFSEGDRLLKQIADVLRIFFPDALLIARYGGDEFAMAIRNDEGGRSLETIRQKLDVDIPKLTGIQVTYGIATYPVDGLTKDDLIVVAEKRLFSMKREIWLQREDHLLRSEKMRMVGELASGMAHEIRNPLTTVRGFLQIAKSNQYNIEPWYDLMMQEITRMSELTAEFLQFSKPHASSYRLKPLNGCIVRVMQLMESESIRTGISIVYTGPEEPVSVLMDPDKIVQVLLNLVKNAYEAMEDGGTVTIDLSVRGEYAVLEVRDQGKGIPEKELEKIFRPFFTTKEFGTGLGLSICQKIVQDHEGIIEVETVTGQGTTFRITLPLGVAQKHA